MERREGVSLERRGVKEVGNDWRGKGSMHQLIKFTQVDSNPWVTSQTSAQLAMNLQAMCRASGMREWRGRRRGRGFPTTSRI